MTEDEKTEGYLLSKISDTNHEAKPGSIIRIARKLSKVKKGTLFFEFYESTMPIKKTRYLNDVNYWVCIKQNKKSSPLYLRPRQIVFIDIVKKAKPKRESIEIFEWPSGKTYRMTN